MSSRLGKILVSQGVVTVEEVARALKARANGERLGDALIRLGYASHAEVAQALSEQTGLAVATLESFEPETALLEAIQTRFVFRARVITLGRENGTLRVGTADTFRVAELDELRLLTGLDVDPQIVARDELDETINRLYGVGADALDRAVDEGVAVTTLTDDGEGDLDGDDDAALIQFVNRLLLDAVAARASDIHVEPTQRELKIRYRVDGVLHYAALPRQLKRFQAAIISRIKIMANLDIAEKRLPQDGRIRLRLSGRELDVRVSVMPTLYGEGLALRLLDTGGKGSSLTLTDVGLSTVQRDTFRRFLSAPHGIVLVTGPTGSGKSTTLHAGLKEIDREILKVITIEDPVEYRLDGVSQIQVREKIGLTFGKGLRHILRHDPDVVMVGEIRDQETAQIAVQASLTGHLVLSTLHTNDASGAIVRLADMGVEPYLVAATLTGLMAQRLLRRICPHCAAEIEADDEQLSLLSDIGLADAQTLMLGAGCEHCRNRGYYGRTGIFELLPVDDGMRQLATDGASAVALRRYVRERGLPSLRTDGVRLVREGVTTPAEVLRVTRAD